MFKLEPSFDPVIATCGSVYLLCVHTHSYTVSLYNLQIIHSRVVDTALVFPHRMGLPYKRALRNITAEFLHKIIQDEVGKKSLFVLLRAYNHGSTNQLQLKQYTHIACVQ